MGMRIGQNHCGRLNFLIAAKIGFYLLLAEKVFLNAFKLLVGSVEILHFKNDILIRIIGFGLQKP
jgi:hypothetical protein